MEMFDPEMAETSGSQISQMGNYGFRYLSPEIEAELRETTKNLIVIPKGIYMVCESVPDYNEGFCSSDIENTEENRLRYLQLILSANLTNYISGFILCEEALEHTMDDGTLLGEYIIKNGYLLGVRIDTGNKKPTGNPMEETITEGYDNIEEKLTKCKKAGVKFIFWKNEYDIKQNQPTSRHLENNSRTTARIAGLSQSLGLVPVLHIGFHPAGDHDIKPVMRFYRQAFAILFKELGYMKIMKEGLVIQCTWVREGTESTASYKLQYLAECTIQVLSTGVLPATSGILIFPNFETSTQATLALNAIFFTTAHKKPWPISFTVGNTKNCCIMPIWRGKDENKEKAQKAMEDIVKSYSAAIRGKVFSNEIEDKKIEMSFIKNYNYN